MVAPFDLNLLVVFDTILTERSVTKAAQKLNLSQPAVSGGLSRLREIFDDELFVRSQGEMIPTPRGLALAQPIRQVVGRIESIREFGRPFDPSTSGQAFAISASDYCSVLLAPLLLNAVALSAPATTISFIDNSRSDTAERLASGEASFAIDIYQSQRDDLRHSFLMREELLVIADTNNRALLGAGLKPGDEIPLDIFCDLPHAIRSTTLAEDGLIGRFLAAASLSRHVRMSVSHFAALGRIVSGTNMLACLPSLMAAELAERYDVSVFRLPISLGTQPYALTMYWHRRDDDNEAHRWMRQTIIRCSQVMDVRAAGLRAWLRRDVESGP